MAKVKQEARVVRKEMDFDSVRKFISEQSSETTVYIGSDSIRYKTDGKWTFEVCTCVIVHKNGRNGARVFGQITKHLDFDQRADRPSMRLMQEVIETANMYLALANSIGTRKYEIHMDISKLPENGSSIVFQQASGYVRAMCNTEAKIKPDAFAGTHAADWLVKHPGQLQTSAEG